MTTLVPFFTVDERKQLFDKRAIISPPADDGPALNAGLVAL